ncbi:MAG: Mini-ribonuclease 3 [bacterium]|jgi:ribonuclease-3 family protein
MTDMPDWPAPTGTGNFPGNDRYVSSLPSLTLAYIGDAVFELFIRVMLLRQGSTKVTTLHNATIKRVRAAAQADFLRVIEPLLTEEEKNVVRRGRNAKVVRTPKNADIQTYHYSTALEALIGYLYLLGRTDRLLYLLGQNGAAPKSGE